MRFNLNDNSDDLYICPVCGMQIEDLNSYCRHCQRLKNRERERRYLIQADPRLSKLDAVCRYLNLYRKILLDMFLVMLGLYGINRYTGMFASWIDSNFRIPVFVIFALFSLCSILYFYIDGRLTRLSNRKLKRKGDVL